MRILLIGTSVLALAACGRSAAPETPPPVVEDIVEEAVAEVESPPVVREPVVPTLTKLWVAEGFDAPEGAAQLEDGSFLISNVNGGGSDRDGNGYISHVGADGTVVEQKWFDGLDAPKGMAIHDDILFVTDIDRVHRIDLISKTPLDPIYVEGAQFLNDATAWQGSIYVSDSRNAQIIRLGKTETEVFLDGDSLNGVNGVLGDGDRMLVSTMASGSLLVAGSDGSLTPIADGMIDADGIGLVPSGGYLVSAWRGEIYFVAEDGTVTSMANTRDEGILQNDLSVFGSTVIVPNWQPGTVTAWRLSAEPQ